jgi:DNA polymerase-3 subunit alpha
MDLIPEFIQRKHGRQPVPRVHPIVDHFTAETYGIMVYQEQVMQIVHGLGDIPLRQAYTLIKAIGKKNRKYIDSVRPTFVAGAAGKGLSKKNAEELFELILKFAGYGFNKSHATGYAIIAYQTAYLKARFPNQYMAALLSYESAARKAEEWVAYLEDCRQTVFPDHSDAHPHRGVEVRPPDVNFSEADFSVVFMAGEPHDACHGHVRFGLGAIRGMPSGAIDAILAARGAGGPFTSIFDFCERVDLRGVNRAAIEALVKSGAFDSVHGPQQRGAVFAAIPDAIASGQSAAADRASGQMSFFEAAIASAPPPRPLPAAAAWDQARTLTAEKEALGFHVSGHPLDAYEPLLRRFCGRTVRGVRALPDRAPLRLGGVLTGVRTRIVRNGRSAGQKMARFTIQDRTGSIEAVIFTDAYVRCQHLVVNDAAVAAVGRIDRSQGEVCVLVDRLIPIEELPREAAAAIELDLAEPSNGLGMETMMHRLDDLLRAASAAANGGARAVNVLLRLEAAGRRVTLRPHGVRVVPDEALLARLEQMVGPEHVRLVPERPPSRSP